MFLELYMLSSYSYEIILLFQSVNVMNQENGLSPSNSTQEASQQDLQQVLDLHQAIAEEHKIIEETRDSHPAPTEASLKDFEHFLQSLKASHEPEKKLEMAINFMQERLAQTGVPHFKEFWDARRVCLDLFKENINPSVRVSLWARYSELCRQARKLKEIFDEQSAFATEQIEIAVNAIEADVAIFPELLDKVPQIDFGVVSFTLEPKFADYNRLQRELNLLNSYASKTSSLRKELIKTEMRIRTKNKFFERLSKIGDAIFPRRKELISQVSEHFASDVERFIETTFSGELRTQELFAARDEIKALQNIAKVLTLNTEAFSQTRQRLSECWDSIRNVVKERRKIVTEQKSAFKKHRDQFMAELEGITKSFEAKELTPNQLEKKLDELVQNMRNTPLGKIEIRELRDKIRDLRSALHAKIQDQDAKARQETQAREQEKIARYEKVKSDLQNLLGQAATQSPDTSNAACDALVKEMQAQSLNRAQKQELDKQVRHVRDAINTKREQEILSCSENDREAIGKLRELLKDKKNQRQEIKTQLEVYRKENGSCGLDFTQSLQYNDMIATEKERLEKVEAGIEEIEDKIDEMLGKN